MAAERVIADKYRLLRLVGQGAAGAVWEAENTLVGRPVAIKMLHAELAGGDHKKRFLAEARAAAKIAHPNVVDVFDLGTSEDGSPFIVMELCVGETLDDIIEKRGAMGVTYACDLMVQVLAALEAAHHLGIVHRDLKPANIMVVHPRPDRPAVKVLDFGIAKGVFGDDVAPDETGLMFGTPAYMAPEQATGGLIDARTDVYAAGAILHELLSGSPPFVGNSATEVIACMLAQPPPSLGSLVQGIPDDIEQAVRSSLAKDADDRPPSVRALMVALGPYTSSGTLPSILPGNASEKPMLLKKRGKGPALPQVTAPVVTTLEPESPPHVTTLKPAAPQPGKKKTLELVVEPSIPPAPGSKRGG